MLQFQKEHDMLLSKMCIRDRTNGANAAVGIQHHLFAGQAGGFHSQTIQHLGLVMVDLVEAPGAQGIGCLLYTSSRWGNE